MNLSDAPKLAAEVAPAAQPLPPALLFDQLAAGVRSDHVWAYVQSAVQTWLAAGGRLSFQACFHIPATPSKYRIQLRDFWLSSAVHELGLEDTSPWRRARALREAVLSFEHKWAAWQRRSQPPEHASPIEGILFFAYRACPSMPRSVAAYLPFVAK